MKHPVKVSVIIPVYNVESYLPFALQSCIDQTLVDVEFICVNDGSTDGSLEILNRYAEIDKRIKVIDKPNGGVSSARNAGLDMANGRFIMFLDPDDYLAENACERVFIESEEGPTDIINFGTEIVPHKPRPTEWHYYALSVHTKRFFEFKPEILFLEPSAKPFIWHQAYSSALLKKSGVRFNESLKLGEDMEFLMCLYPHADKIAFIEDKLYCYRHIRKNSAMQVLRADKVKRMKQHLTVVEKTLCHWDANGFTEKYGEWVLSWALEFIVHDLIDEDFSAEERKILSKKLYDCFVEHNLLSFKKKLDRNGEGFYRSLNKFLKG